MKSLKHVYKNLMSERYAANISDISPFDIEHLHTHSEDFSDVSDADALRKKCKDIVNVLGIEWDRLMSSKTKFKIVVNDNEKSAGTYNLDVSHKDFLAYIFYLHKTNETSFNLSSISALPKKLFESKNSLNNIFFILENESNDAKIKIETIKEEVLNNFFSKISKRSKDDSTLSGGEGIVTNVLSVRSINDFYHYMFAFLYNKVVEKSVFEKKEAVNLDKFNADFSHLISAFKDKINSAQTQFTVNFGAYFEEIFNMHVKAILSDNEKPETLDENSIKSYLTEPYNADVKNASKKISIVLMMLFNGIFNSDHSAVFSKLESNSIPDDADYVKDFKARSRINNIENLHNGIRNLIESYKSLLSVSDNNNIFYDDIEKDAELIKKIKALETDNNVSKNRIVSTDTEGIDKITNSPFDFIIRNTKTFDFGMFDLKATNVNTANKPLASSATGANKKNSALNFINYTLDGVKKLSENNSGAIKFFGLVQIEYELDWNPNNNHEMSFKSLKHKIGSPSQSFEKSEGQNKFILRDKSGNKITDDIALASETEVHHIYRENLSNNYDSFIKSIDVSTVKKTNEQKLIEEIYATFKLYFDAAPTTSLIEHIRTNIVNYKKDSDFIKVYKGMFNPDYYVIFEKAKHKLIDESNLPGSINDKNTFIEKLSKIRPTPEEFLDTFCTLDADKEKLIRWRSLLNPSTLASTQSRTFDRNITDIIYNKGQNVESVKELFNDYLNTNRHDQESIDEICNDITTNHRNKTIERITKYINEERSVNIEERKLKDFLINKLNKKYSEDTSGVQEELEELDNYFNEYSMHGMGDAYIRQGQTLIEVYSNLFKKKLIAEGGLGGHMMHPYEMLDSTPREMINQIKRYSLPQSIVEKVDGQNLFFTVERDGTLLFARNKEDMTHDDLIEKFKGHGAEKPFVEGGNAIKNGVEQGLAGREEEVIAIFHPSEDVRSFINFEIMHPEKPNQIRYDKKYIVFHSIVDYKEGRVQVGSSSTDERITRLINLIRSGIESSGFILASNQTVDLNTLEDVQISEYEDRVMDASSALRISDDQTFADGIMNIISDELQAEGVVISDEALSILRDYVIYGEDESGRKIHSKEFTKIISKEDAAKLRSLGLTTSTKVMSKIGRILMPFKDIFVDLGIDLLKGVKSSYMSDDYHQQNIEDIKDKLQTAINDIDRYTSEVAEENWSNVIIRLMPHVRKVKQKGIDNIVASSVEGGVYSHDDNLMKLTGGFAPMNQIVGAAYRDNEGIFTEFKSKFMQNEGSRKSLRGVFSLIF